MRLPRPCVVALLAAAAVALACADATGPDARRGSIAVTGLPDTLWTSVTDTLAATVRDRDGNVLAADSVRWRSSDTTTVFVVDSLLGIVRGREDGDAWLIVSARGIVDSARVHVERRPVATPAPFIGHAVGALSFLRCGVSTQGAAWCTGASTAYAEVPGGLVFREVQAGQRGQCGIATDDRMHCWGRNDYWSLGTGTAVATNVTATTPVIAAGGRTFSRLAVGVHMTTCGIGKADSLAWCWGHNDLGQTGRPSTGGEPDPMPVPGVPKVVDLSIGIGEGCAVTVDGALWCWGGGGLDASIAPRQMAPAGSYVEVQASTWGVCARRPDGVAECGALHARPDRPVSGGTLRFASLYGSDDRMCGLTAAGELHCWSLFDWNGVTPVVATPYLRGRRFRSGSEGQPFCGVTADGKLYC